MTHHSRLTLFAMYSRWNGRTPQVPCARKQEVDGRDATRQVRENKNSCASLKAKQGREKGGKTVVFLANTKNVDNINSI
jgi:hypothetical protein